MEIQVSVPDDAIRDTFLTRKARAMLESMGNITWNQKDKALSDDEMLFLISKTEVLITGWNVKPITKNMIDKAKKLKIIAHLGGTVGGLIDKSAYIRGIKVISGNKVFAESVAEGVLCYALTALRRIPFYMQEMKESGWKTGDDVYEGLFDKKVGIVGFGAVAKNLVSLLKPFRVEISAFDPYLKDEVLDPFGVKRVGIDDIFSDSKLITINLPRIPETYHMINGDLLKKIPDGSVLINTSRGSVVDESHLIEELKKNRFSTVLDVYEKEPLPLDSVLRKLPNTYLLPHMAGPTVERREAAAISVIEDIKNYFEGKTLINEITKEYAERMTR